MLKPKNYILTFLFCTLYIVSVAQTNWVKSQFEELLSETVDYENKSDSSTATKHAIKQLSESLGNGIEKYPLVQADYYLALQLLHLKTGDVDRMNFYLDAARKVLEQPANKKSLWKYHLQKGHSLINVQQYDEAKKYYLLAIDGLSETENKETLVKTMMSLATSLKIQKSDDSSILLYKKAIQLAEEYGMEEEAILSKSRLGNLLYKNNKIAAKYFHEIYEHSKKGVNRKRHLFNCIDMAKLYLVLGQHKKAIEYYDEALLLVSDIDDEVGRTTNHTNRLNLLKVDQLIELELLEDAKELLEETEITLLNQHLTCYKQLLTGKIAFGFGDKTKAIQKFRTVLSTCDDILTEQNSDRELRPVYYHLATCLFYSGKMNAALDTLNLAIQSENLDIKTTVNCYNLQSKIYEKQGKYKQSLAAFKQKDVWLDSLISLNRIGTYLTEQANLEVAKKEMEIGKLEGQKSVMQAAAKTRRNIILALLMGIAGLGIGGWFYSRHRKVALEKDLAEVKQNLLRIQINPHFIFNALNSIQSSFLMDDQEKTLHLFNKFSNLMRQILENSANSFIPLNEEIELLINYMELEKVRSNNKFDYKVEIDDGIDIYNEEIPSMVLQIFVENSIWHGVIPKEDRGLITIKVGKENGSIKVSVIDNGVGRTFSLKHKSKDQQNKTSMGTKLVTQRIDLLNRKFGKNLQLDILDGNTEGTVVQLLI